MHCLMSLTLLLSSGKQPLTDCQMQPGAILTFHPIFNQIVIFVYGFEGLCPKMLG